VVAPVLPTYRHPPGIYRLARALRWLSTLVVVVLVIYAGTVVYSAYEVARSSPQSRGFTASFAPNGTVEIGGSFTLSNSGFYPIQSFSLTARITNASGVFLGKLRVGPTAIAPSSTGVFPVAVYLPVTSGSAAESLLTQDQYLGLSAWGNATYAYLFPLSVTLSETRSWGAPFEGFTAKVGTPGGGGGTVTLPVTITFTNDAGFTEVGTLAFTVQSAVGAVCGSSSFPIDVPPQDLYDQTETVSLNTGCSPAGGQVVATYTSGGTTVVLPPEAIP
jgi:hypothetical protein